MTKFNLFSKSCLFASPLSLWNIFETCKKRIKWSLFHILNGYAHIYLPIGTCHGPWNSRVVSLVWPLLASQSSTQRLDSVSKCYKGVTSRSANTYILLLTSASNICLNVTLMWEGGTVMFKLWCITIYIPEAHAHRLSLVKFSLRKNRWFVACGWHLMCKNHLVLIWYASQDWAHLISVFIAMTKNLHCWAWSSFLANYVVLQYRSIVNVRTCTGLLWRNEFFTTESC